MEPITVPQPYWATVSVESILKACYSGDVDAACEEAVAKVLQLKDYKFDMADACVVDFFVTVVWWCRTQQLQPEQAAVVIDLARKELCDIKLKNTTISDVIRNLKISACDMVAKNASADSSATIPVENFLQFMNNILVQHHKLWEFFFHRLHEETVICKQLVVETAPPVSIPWPPPLNEGCSEALYRSYVKPTPISATAHARRTPATSATTEPTTTATERPGSGATASVKQDQSPRQSAKSAGRHKSGPKTPAFDREKVHEEILELDRQTIKKVIETTSREVAQSVQQDLLAKIRDRENTILTKINQVHQKATEQ